MQGEIFDEVIEDLNLQAQEELLEQYKLMNYRNIINKGTTILKKNAILTANIDAEWLLSIAIKKTREKILLNLEDELKKGGKFIFNKLLSTEEKSRSQYHISEEKNSFGNMIL